MTSAAQLAMDLTEHSLVPDVLVRHGIRRLLRDRLHTLATDDCEERSLRTDAFVRDMQSGPVAPLPEKANEQHYEVPAAFFAMVLGQHRKYSSCYWEDGVTTLDAAEAAALRETCRHAALSDGQHILELGCGWGSLTLWMAEKYPHSQITAVSNSNSQRKFIESEVRRRGLDNDHMIMSHSLLK